MTPESETPLRIGDVGSFEELNRKPNPDGLALQYIPGIEALLTRAKQLKGEALSESQVASIRAKSTVMATTEVMAAAVIQERGYE